MRLPSSSLDTPWHALLVLGRVSNLPTVWSNCLAGWLLAGGGSGGRFAAVCLGASFLYLGGMYLNDAFDAPFDRQHRRDRPIPAGWIGERTVWQLGFGWLTLGTLWLGWLDHTTAVLTSLLVLAILLYDAIHKALVLAPVVMGLCRVLVYLVAGAASDGGLTGLAIWSGLALGAYVAGLSWVARRENAPEGPPRWPAALLGVPILLALVVNGAGVAVAAWLLSLLLATWIAVNLYLTHGTRPPATGRAVGGLLAGIVLVDWLAVGLLSPGTALAFLLLFALTLLAQRFIPAT